MKKYLLLFSLFFNLIFSVGAQTILGIDVYSGTGGGSISWPSVYGAGKTFSFVKATKGLCYTDGVYYTNMANATSAGVKVGAYHFALPEDNPGTAGAIAEANYFLAAATSPNRIGTGYLPPVLDLEDPAGTCIIHTTPLTAYFTSATLTAWVVAWANRVQTVTGVAPIIYTSSSIASYLGSSVTAYKLWIANPGTSPTTPPSSTGVWPTWAFKQYSWTGTVPGISGAVDLNVFNGSITDFNLLLGLGSTCTGWAVSPTTQSAPQGGGSYSGTVSIASGSGCSYTLTFPDSWIHFTSYGSSGSGLFNYTVDPNISCSSRIGHIYVNDFTGGVSSVCTLTVNQSGYTTPGVVTVSGGGTYCSSPVTISAFGGSGGIIYFQGTTSGGTSTAMPSTSQIIGSSGTYYFRSYNGSCWGPEGSVTVTISSPPSGVSVSGGGTYCGSATLTASGGSGGTIYWQGTTSGGMSTSTVSTSQTVSSSGTYYFRSYNGSCWGTEGSVTVVINPTPSAVSVSGGGAYCASSTILNASGGSGGTIYWQGTTSGGTSTSTASTSQTVTSSGTYYFRSYNGTCWGPEGSVTVTISSTPSAVSVSGSGTYCGSATLTATGGSGGTIYWQGTTPLGTSTSTASTSQTVTSSGTYYFRSYNGTCWGPEGSVTVTVNPTPSVVTVSGGGIYCASSTILNASGGIGGTIYWQGTTSGGTSTSTASTSQTVTSSGTYYFRSYNGTCWGTEGSVTVTISSIPSAVSVSGSGTYCGSVTLTATGSTGDTIYWQGTTSGGMSTVTASTSQMVSTSGTYYFRSHNGCGWGVEGSATVTISPVPAPVTVSGGGTFCGGSITLTASGGSGGTIYWQGTTSGGTSTVTASTSQIVTSSGTYYFRSFNGSCWSVEGNAIIVYYPTPIADFAASQTSGNCPFFVDFYDLSTANGTASWLWTIYNGSSSPITSTLQNPTGILYNVLGSYLVKLKVTDTCGNDTKIAASYITVTGDCGTGIETVRNNTEIIINPNPSIGTFEINSYEEILNVVVTNVIGEKIESMTMNKITKTQQLIDLSNQPSGIYFITVEMEDRSVKKMVVKL